MDFVGNLSLFEAMKKITNRLRIDKVIAMDRLAQFFSDSQCIQYSNSNVCYILRTREQAAACHVRAKRASCGGTWLNIHAYLEQS